MDDEGDARVRAAYGVNFERLRTIKADYDAILQQLAERTDRRNSASAALPVCAASIAATGTPEPSGWYCNTAVSTRVLRCHDTTAQFRRESFDVCCVHGTPPSY